MEEKIYTCECGKTFTKPNSFNGHKSGCKVHAMKKGTWEQVREIRVKLGKSSGIKLKTEAESRKTQNTELWLAEQHSCERCGKIMTEKYGSGRFCSRSCANSRNQSVETRSKIALQVSKTIEKQGYKIRQQNESKYLENPNRCVICGSILSYDNRLKLTCSKQCYSFLRADIRQRTIEEKGLNCGKLIPYKYGFYKGIECDSGWELAFLIYNLDNNQNIVRNKEYFTYSSKGKICKYYPDFIIDNIYYEIKGYKDSKFYEKLEQFPKDKQLIVIDQKSIGKYLKFVIEKYGENYYDLYDLDKPSWRSG